METNNNCCRYFYGCCCSVSRIDVTMLGVSGGSVFKDDNEFFATVAEKLAVIRLS